MAFLQPKRSKSPHLTRWPSRNRWSAIISVILIQLLSLMLSIWQRQLCLHQSLLPCGVWRQTFRGIMSRVILGLLGVEFISHCDLFGSFDIYLSGGFHLDGRLSWELYLFICVRYGMVGLATMLISSHSFMHFGKFCFFSFSVE